jgi:hypothetical protein
MTTDLHEALAPVRADPGRSVLLFDFDGTLSPVVDDPAAAVARPGVAERLDRLAASYRLVGAVSGRPVAFLANVLPPSLALSGLYGLESRLDGKVAGHPEADRWRPVVTDAVATLAAATAPGEAAHGVVVEAKGLSITLHVRTRPDLGDAARNWRTSGGHGGLAVAREDVWVHRHRFMHRPAGLRPRPSSHRRRRGTPRRSPLRRLAQVATGTTLGWSTAELPAELGTPSPSPPGSGRRHRTPRRPRRLNRGAGPAS